MTEDDHSPDHQEKMSPGHQKALKEGADLIEVTELEEKSRQTAATVKNDLITELRRQIAKTADSAEKKRLQQKLNDILARS